MTIRVGGNIIAGAQDNAKIQRGNIGEIVTSTIPLTDAGLHLLDGSVIQRGSYADFVDYIADLYNNDDTEIMYAWKAIGESDADYVYTKTTNITSSTILYNADGTIYNKANYPRYEIFKTGLGRDYYVWYFLTAEGSSSADYRERSSIDSEENIYNFSQNFLTTEKDWQSAVTTHGVCGKFVYDSVNQTVRLPKYSDKIYTGGGTAAAKGNGKALGLTDGVNNSGLGTLDKSVDSFVGSQSTFYNQDIGYTHTGSWDNSGTSYATGITTDATKSGIITDLSTLTTALDGYWYIVIATSTKTDIEVDIDEIATDLNGKVDKANLAPVHVVVETYQNGMEWYRIYDDGWCEQGGESPNKTYTSINLLKPFKDTNYYLNASTLTTSFTSNAAGNAYARIISASQVGIGGYNDGNWTLPRWEAKGYIS